MKQVDLGSLNAKVTGELRSLLTEPVILLDQGIPVGVLLPVEDADVETVSLSLNPQFLAIIERSKKRMYTEGGLSTEEICQKLGIELPKTSDANSDRRKRKATSRPEK